MARKLAPSILAADLSNLASSLELCETAPADLVHVDVMDGHFVPNLTFGIPVVEALARRTSLPLDVHLMVEEPGRLLERYLEAGAARVAVHWEAAVHLDRLVEQIRRAGVAPGVALNPATPVEVLEDVLPALGFVLLMSVNPGFGGQKLLAYVVEKARRLRSMMARRRLQVEIAMDGGIGPGNIESVADAGVEVFVVGSAVFGSADPVEAMRALRQKLEATAA